MTTEALNIQVEQRLNALSEEWQKTDEALIRMDIDLTRRQSERERLAQRRSDLAARVSECRQLLQMVQQNVQQAPASPAAEG